MSAVKRLKSPLKTDNHNAQKKIKLKGQEEACIQPNDFLFLLEQNEDFDFSEFDKATKLDLSEWKRCTVTEIERDNQNFDLILRLSGDGSSATTCRLQGPWASTNILSNATVCIQGVWDERLQSFKVNAEQGFCVTNPDTLIPTTSVVGSLFCRRKSVLQERFRGIDANSKVMVIGSLVHELLQVVLRKDLRTYKQVEQAASELLTSTEVAYMLYASLLTREETEKDIMEFLPTIMTFIEQYIDGKEPNMIQKDMFQGTIDEVKDIEENVWVPRLGLKGKIDVTVNVRRHRKASFAKSLLPLELKTGRATFSAEHKGQVILYQMMLTAIGRATNSGLLLYLREGIMREVVSTRNDQRDLIMLRNELSHYLTLDPSLPPANESLVLDNGKLLQPFSLPEPISHHSACGHCPYATLCCTFAKTDPQLELRDNHPLRKVMETSIEHLTAEEYTYFMRWCSLLALEDKEAKKSNYMRMLWTETPETRQQIGRAIVGLELMHEVVFEASRYVHTFALKKENIDARDLTMSGFSMGEYVIVSTEKRLAVAAGLVSELHAHSIAISVERNLLKNYRHESFIIDKHDSNSVNIFNFTNLGLLLNSTERASQLRDIIIYRHKPNFAKMLPKVVATKGATILKSLNSIQRAAVIKALTTESYMLIKGLPGTGKTQTLVAIIRLLHLMGKTVLITSHTHSAVDNLLFRLVEHELPMIRLGSGERIKAELRQFGESEVLKDCHTEAEIAQKYAEYSIVGVTCLGSSHSIFLYRKFDYCIVDEATQVLQPTVLRPLFFCEKFILVGDPDQLPPLIRSREGRQRGADISLFEHLDTEQTTSMLTLQYRMNKTITKLANELTYGGGLQCASSETEKATIQISLPAEVGKQKWLQRVLHPHLDQAVFFLDTLDCGERSMNFANSKSHKTSLAIEENFGEDVDATFSTAMKEKCTKARVSKYTNYCEAAVVIHLLRYLLMAGYPLTRIGVIAPYRAQVELLRKLLQSQQSYVEGKRVSHRNMPEDFGSIEVNTVDQYQGRDKDIIIYSCTKTGTLGGRDIERARDAEILEDKRRLTVAITRSKYKLILIGDAGCLQQYTPFKTLLANIRSYCTFKLEDGKLGFDWQTLLNDLNAMIGLI